MQNKKFLIILCLFFVAVNSNDINTSIGNNATNYVELDTFGNTTFYQSFVAQSSQIFEIHVWMAYQGEANITLCNPFGVSCIVSDTYDSNETSIEEKNFTFSSVPDIIPGSVYFIGIQFGRVAADDYGSNYQDGNVWSIVVNGSEFLPGYEDIRIDIYGTFAQTLPAGATSSTLTMVGSNTTCTVPNAEYVFIQAKKTFTLIAIDIVNRPLLQQCQNCLVFSVGLLNKATNRISNIVLALRSLNDQSSMRRISSFARFTAGQTYRIGYINTGDPIFGDVQCGGPAVTSSSLFDYVKDQIGDSESTLVDSKPQLYLRLYVSETSFTTGRITSGRVTSGKVTSGIVTSRFTTSPLTTRGLTTGSLTTSEITSEEMTTSPMTTSPLTTSPITSESMTTGQDFTTGSITSGEITTSPTTDQLTSGDLTTSEITSSELTTQIQTSESFTTQSQTSGSQTSQAQTTGSFTSAVQTSGSVITEYHGETTEFYYLDTTGGISPSPPGSIAGALVGFGIGIVVLVSLGIAGIALSKSRSEVELEAMDIAIIGDIEIKKKLGEGSFGDVYLGLWNGTKVALKQLKDKSHHDEFTKEVITLRQVKHPNCVQFLGIYTNKTEDVFMVTEYLPLGALANVLQSNHTLSLLDLMNMCIGACKGLAYLEGMGIIHRDVSLRNLLAAQVNEKYSAKVSDFGLSRISSTGTYEITSSSKLPVKWTSPEVLMGGAITIKNDVWAFGVTMWEIFSLGAPPFPWLSNKEAFVEIPKGERLPVPDRCPPDIYQIMLKCWIEQSQRPSFVMVLFDLKAIRKPLAQNNKVKEIEDPILAAEAEDARKRNTLSTPYNNLS